MRFRTIAISLAAVAAITPSAVSQQQDAGRTAFRAIYQEMVETDTSAGTGSCTKMEIGRASCRERVSSPV